MTTGISATTPASSISASGGPSGMTDTSGETASDCQPSDCEELDGDPCTWPTCDQGTCVEVAADCSGGMDNECAQGECNPGSGLCEYAGVDANCDAAMCMVGTCEIELDSDGELIQSHCLTNTVSDEPCDDGSACTENDTCLGGECAGDELTCDVAPEAVCLDAMTLQIANLPGACGAVGCEYQMTEVPCAAGCAAGQCAGPDHAVISELLYDTPGIDEDVWIELWLPPGTSLADVSLEFVNGANGAVGATLQLVGALPADGLVLIVHPSASDPVLLAAADMTNAFADLQNGPDNLRLLVGGVVSDAVGWGGFAGATFVGEGDSAQDVSGGQSLSRSSSWEDTDNNAVDFFVDDTPTPGAVNG